ncbi:phage tail tube protein [Magnetococcus sp. PR-3]|uniref:phage tail tube protein n=1 Tax=Magnetococcus sp. PR-3 TaxID=3120355 RepID=UPI002FCDE7E0
MGKSTRHDDAIRLSVDGDSKTKAELVAQGEAASTSSGGGTPDSLPLKRFGQFQGAIKRAGSAIANLTSGNLTYSNNLDKVETIRNDGKIDGADPTVASASGTITTRFADTTLMDLASNGTAVDLELSYTLDADNKLVITLHEVYLPKPKIGMSGPGGIEASFDYVAAFNSSAGQMMTVALVNDLDGTEYA